MRYDITLARCSRSRVWLAVAALTLVAGCSSGSSSQQTSATQDVAEPASSAAPVVTASPTPTTPPLTEVGTISESDTGVQVTETMSLGKLSYGNQTTAPTAYFTACNRNFTGAVAISAFVPVKLMFAEPTGSIAEHVYLGAGEGYGQSLFGDEPLSARLVLTVDGAPVCEQDSGFSGGAPTITVAPHSSTTVSGYIIFPGVLSNANPTSISADDLNEFEIGEFSTQDLGTGAFDATGSQVAQCRSVSYPVLLPLATFPFTTASGGSCTKA